MQCPDIIIAVDGYSSTGKSSFAKLLSFRLGLTYLDSGAIYRAVTLFAHENALVSNDGTVCSDLKERLDGLDIYFGNGGTFISGRCVEKEIRSMVVSSLVSRVAAQPYVREFVDNLLHEMGRKGKVVMDGRDIGTTVFPQAEVKIFMTASVEVRTRRRYDELVAKGGTPTVEEVRDNLLQRDYIDSHREISPLARAADAFLLDNSSMTMDEELAWATGLIQGKFALLD